MPTRLEKITLESYTPGTPGSPGFSGQPFLPARTVFRTVQVCNYIPYTQSEIQAIYASYGATYVNSGPPDYAWVLTLPPGIASISIPTGRLVCRDEVRQINLPGQPYIAPIPFVPASPASTERDFQLGWNARARSIVPMPAAGRFSFRVPSSVVGVVVGLSPNPRDTNFLDIRWGFRVVAGVLTIVEAGVEVASVGAHDSADVLSIERSFGEITYRVNDDIERTTPSEGSPMYLTAAMYSGGDEVLEAEFAALALGEGESAMAPMQAFGSDTSGYSIGVGVMAPMTGGGLGWGTGGASSTLAPMSAFGADAGGYSAGVGVMAPMTAEGEGIEELTYAISAGFMAAMVGSASGLTGTVGGAAHTLAPMEAQGAETADLYGTARAVMAPMTAYGENFGPQTEATMFSLVFALHGQQPVQELFVIMNSNMEVVGLITATLVLPADVESSITATTPTVLQSEIEAFIRSVMSAYALSNDSAADTQAWVTNMGILGSTRYTNYGFNALAKVGSNYYGTNDQGLFLLNGDDDAGESIDALINFGNLNFGSSERKKLPYCYVGVASNGNMILRVEADGQTYYYDVRANSEEMKMQRFEPGKGLRATYYGLTLINEGGSLFDLESVEFFAVPLTRRL